MSCWKIFAENIGKLDQASFILVIAVTALVLVDDLDGDEREVMGNFICSVGDLISAIVSLPDQQKQQIQGKQDIKAGAQTQEEKNVEQFDVVKQIRELQQQNKAFHEDIQEIRKLLQLN